MNIAIVGAGVSGLVTAWLLSKKHTVTVFEADLRIGGHTCTLEVPWGGATYAVDTGFIVFNAATYPNFIRLLEHLGVERQPSDMSFGVKCEQTGLEYSPGRVSGLFAQKRNLMRPSFLRMLADIFRFRKAAARQMLSTDTDATLGDFLSAEGYSESFIRHFIIPMGAAIWSADPVQFERFPLLYFIRFFTNHGFLQWTGQPRWYVVKGGSRSYLKPLTRPFEDRIRTGAPVRSVRRFPNHAEIRSEGAEPERFDQVVIAAHSDQALAMLADPSDEEQEILGSLPYQENQTLLHTDTRVMPKRRAAWASWNYRIPRESFGRVTVTYHMNRLQSLSAPVDFLVSLNQNWGIHPDRILADITYHHPVYTPTSLRAQRQRDRINGLRRTWYCGAYWGYGFHEDGVNSALHVARRLAGITDAF